MTVACVLILLLDVLEEAVTLYEIYYFVRLLQHSLSSDCDTLLLLHQCCSIVGDPHVTCNISLKHGSALNTRSNDFISRCIKRVTSRKQKSHFGSRCKG